MVRNITAMEKIRKILLSHNLRTGIIAIIIMVIISMVYFFPDDLQGNVLQQPDSRQGLAVGHEAKLFEESTGETTFWTNSLFGGMPMFQISPSYPSNELFSWITRVLTLWLPTPANLLFLMMIGFYIFLLSIKMRWYMCLLGAVAWGLSSYFMILIGAGHIWKYLTLAYIPPTLAGIILCYRGKYLIGTACCALFGMMQLSSNHVQMTYYFLFVVFGFIVYFFIKSEQEKHLRVWYVGTLSIFLAAILSVGANLPNLYNTYEYSKETIRGKYSDISVNEGNADSGLSHDYITQYSYGITETMTLLIPNVKGGASNIPMKGEIKPLTLAELDNAQEKMQNGEISQETAYNLQFLYQYFGGEEGTNGPVYIGALMVAMFILGCLIVRGPIKWILVSLTVLSVALSWGRNYMWLTEIFINYIPLYSKFRTPESILVIAQFTMPLLGIIALQQILQSPAHESLRRYGKKIKLSFAISIFLCVIGILFPSFYGNAIQDYEIKMGINNFPELYSTAQELRHGLVRADSFRSFIILLLGFGSIMLYFYQKITLRNFIIVIGVILVGDMYLVNKRFVNHECFMAKEPTDQLTFPLTIADKAILSDTSMNYRVMDLKRFASPDPSYHHKMIGGYHPAKLTRYQDLISYYLNGEKDFSNMLNMLNTRYIIEDPQKEPLYNGSAMGNAWIVDSIIYVESPIDEITRIEDINLRSTAVADISFKTILDQPKFRNPGDTIFETTYAPNRLTYSLKSANEGVAVFSEIYFPWGWRAYIDGKPTELGRVNYILRAIKFPAGKHTIEMVFNPDSLRITVTIATVCILIIYILLAISAIIAAKNYVVKG